MRFSRLRFEQYAADLSAAIRDLSRENRMSIEDLKQRLANVPGIEKLTMRLEAGKQVFSVGGGFVAVDPLATDPEIEAAIRSVPAPAAAPNITPLPAVTMTDPAPTPAKVATAMPTSPADAHMTVKDMMQAHMDTMRNIQEAQFALLQATLDRQVKAVSASVGTVADKIDGQTDDFLAMMGQFSNGMGL